MIHVTAAIVANRGANVFRHAVEVAQQVFGGVFSEVGVFFNGRVEIVDVGGVMLVVMQMHRRSSMYGSRAAVVVRKGWNFVCQSISPWARLMVRLCRGVTRELGSLAEARAKICSPIILDAVRWLQGASPAVARRQRAAEFRFFKARSVPALAAPIHWEKDCRRSHRM